MLGNYLGDYLGNCRLELFLSWVIAVAVWCSWISLATRGDQ